MPTKEELFEEASFDFSMGELDVAIEKFHQALSVDPDFYDAQLGLVEAFFRKGDYDRAIREGERLLQISPNDQMAHTSLSRCYLKKDMKPEAEHHAAQARIAGWREELKNTPPKRE